ncbi:MAG: hypothetical protein H0W02_14665 [Ktedonobacteraceae bacterium]|nr:hypothetical protein [Ktedonobacteraceae bacterium]
MGNEPIVSAAFGWGRVFRLYSDHLDAGGVSYDLKTLTCVHPTYRQVLGIPSARLELVFGRERLVLRGIAAIDDARRMVAYLTEHYPAAHLPSPPTGWQRTREPEDEEQERDERAQAITAPIAVPRRQQARRELHQPRLQYPRTARTRAGSSWSRRVMHHFKRDELPPVPVPVRLPAGEYACYSAEATLCGECVLEPAGPVYPTRDHGLLILTNRRLLYIGRKSQILLGYARLFHVSRLSGAVAFLADYWHKREIFVMRHPLECVMCLERILRQFRQEERTPLARQAVYLEESILDEEAYLVSILAGTQPQRVDLTDEVGPRNELDVEAVRETQKVAGGGPRKSGERRGRRDDRHSNGVVEPGIW